MENFYSNYKNARKCQYKISIENGVGEVFSNGIYKNVGKCWCLSVLLQRQNERQDKRQLILSTNVNIGGKPSFLFYFSKKRPSKIAFKTRLFL